MAEAASQAVLDIFNLALGHVGNKPVSSPADSPECQLHYPSVRDKALMWAPWTFATFTKSLVKLADNEGEALGALGRFLFLYAIPNTPPVLRTLEIHLSGFQYQLRMYTPPDDPEHPQRVIATSAESVILQYIGRVSEGFWSPIFTSAVGLWLAVEISQRIARKATLRQQLYVELSATLDRAIDIDGHQDSPPRAILNQTYIHGRFEDGVPPMSNIQEPLQPWP